MNKYIILVSISLFFVVFVNANSRFPLSSLISNPFDESNDVTIKKSGTIKLPKLNSVKRIGKIGMNIKSLFEDATCSLPNNCIGVGATCDSDYTTNDEYCSNSTAKCCASNLFCVNKVCATTLIGSACITNSTIPNNSFYVCVNNVIQLIRYPGDSCSSNGECYGSTCVNGVCQGAALNQNCDYNNLCQPSNYCYYNITNKLNSTCTAPAANGHACDNSVYGVQCQPQLYCNQGKCAIPYLGSDGDTCTYDKDCGVSMSCIKGTCTTNTLVMTSCKSNKDCGTLSTCQCMGTGGLLCAPPNMTHLPNDPCAVQYYNLEKCAFENNCEIYPSVLFLMENLITDNSQYCISSKCTKPLHKLRECTCVAKTVPSVCYHNPGVQICGALRKYEYFLVIIGCSFAGVTFVLMGICLVDRKRRGDRSWF